MSILDKVKVIPRGPHRLAYSKFALSLPEKEFNDYLETLAFINSFADSSSPRPSLDSVLAIIQEELGFSPSKTTLRQDLKRHMAQCQTQS